jgi:hypothetical protein
MGCTHLWLVGDSWVKAAFDAVRDAGHGSGLVEREERERPPPCFWGRRRKGVGGV